MMSSAPLPLTSLKAQGSQLTQKDKSSHHIVVLLSLFAPVRVFTQVFALESKADPSLTSANLSGIYRSFSDELVVLKKRAVPRVTHSK